VLSIAKNTGVSVMGFVGVRLDYSRPASAWNVVIS
jgi:hypothetical protein